MCPSRIPAGVRGWWSVFVLVLAGILSYPPAVEAAKLGVGDRAVTFTTTNFQTGEELDLGKHLGRRVILLDFGSIYCSSCMLTIPNLIKLRKKHSEEDLAIMNIYLDIYNRRRVIRFFRGFGGDINIDLAIDDTLAISREYGITTLPTTVIIDRGGKIRHLTVGYTEEDEKKINKTVEDLIKELPLVGAAVVEATGGINILVPESFAKTRQEEVFVVGSVAGLGTKDVSLKLNNLTERMTQAQDQIFHFRTPLSLAMNIIEIKGRVAEGVVQNQSLVLFREPYLGGAIQSDLPIYRFHREDEKKPCSNCHKLEIPLQEKSSLQQSELCLGCHGNLAAQLYTHGPITVGGCLPCHDYQSFPNKYELRASGPELCFSCHEQVKDSLASSKFVHGPVAAGVCVVCHSPHGSSEKFFIRKKMDQLCMGCHQLIRKEFAKEYLHRPVQEGNCHHCHNPHGSSQEKLLVMPKETLCTKCHDITFPGHQHRIGQKPKTEFPPGTSLDANGGTVCITCHLFHASDYSRLKRGPQEVCGSGCHLKAEAQVGQE